MGIYSRPDYTTTLDASAATTKQVVADDTYGIPDNGVFQIVALNFPASGNEKILAYSGTANSDPAAGGAVVSATGLPGTYEHFQYKDGLFVECDSGTVIWEIRVWNNKKSF